MYDVQQFNQQFYNSVIPLYQEKKSYFVQILSQHGWSQSASCSAASHSHLHGRWKSAWNRRKGGVLAHAQTALAAWLYHFFVWGIGLVTSRARSRCWSLRFTIHLYSHKHSEALALWGGEKDAFRFLIFLFKFGTEWAELNRRLQGFWTSGRFWWHGVVKQERPSKQAQRDRETEVTLCCASCLNADNQLEIYMTVLLHYL